MSQAFLRENDIPQLPELPPVISPLPPGARNYLTQGGFNRLKNELDRLLDSERPRLTSLDIEDIDIRRELQVLDQRIRYLQESLRTAEVVSPPEGSENVVRFGATVTVLEKSTHTTYRIVGVDETDLDRGWVSFLSPIARALINAQLGQTVKFKAPSGMKELQVSAIEYAQS